MSGARTALGLGAAVVAASAVAWSVLREGPAEMPEGPAPRAAAEAPSGRRPRARAHEDAVGAASEGLDAARRAAATLGERLATVRDAAGARVPPRDGLWVRRADGDRVVEAGEYVRGARTGLWIETSPDGCRSETQYEDGVKHGREVTWFPDGRPRFLGANDRGAPCGTWTSWFPDGRLRSTREYLDGKVHGKMLTFHPNGAVETESSYWRGLDSGPSYGWYDDGSPQFVVPYDAGRRRGEAVWYHRNGRVAARGTYADDVLDGEYVAYSPDGAESSVEVWRGGVKVSGPAPRETATGEPAEERR